MKATRNYLIGLICAVLTATTTSALAGEQKGPKGDSVIDVAIAANAAGGAFEGQLDILILALSSTADEEGDPTLADVLDSRNGQVTVFAPTDDAFGKLPEGLLGDLLADKASLVDVLLYHVAKGRRDADDVITSSQIRMFNGEFVGVTLDGELAFLTDNSEASDDAQIIAVNVPAANGIIHVIDEVLIP